MSLSEVPGILTNPLIARIKKLTGNNSASIQALDVISQNSDWSKDSIEPIAKNAAVILGQLEAAKYKTWEDEIKPLLIRRHLKPGGSSNESMLDFRFEDFERAAKVFANSEGSTHERMSKMMQSFEHKNIPEDLRMKFLRPLAHLAEIEEAIHVFSETMHDSYTQAGHGVLWRQTLHDTISKLKHAHPLEMVSPTMRIETIMPAPPAAPPPVSEVISLAAVALQSKARKLLFGDGTKGWNLTEMTDPFGKDGANVQHVAIYERTLDPNIKLTPEMTEAITAQLHDLGCNRIHVGTSRRLTDDGEYEVPRIWVEAEDFNIRLRIACERANLIQA